MNESSPRGVRNREATRSRITETALQLFVSQGFAETTIDQIATVSGVGRRTIFRYFPTKEAMLLDHLVGRRERIVAMVSARPAGESALVSLHTVLRELSAMGYDRRALGQIRAVLATEPGLLGDELTVGEYGFEKDLLAALMARGGPETFAEIRALTHMALSWLGAAGRAYFVEGRSSLVEAFDEVVSTCLRGIAELDDTDPG